MKIWKKLGLILMLGVSLTSCSTNKSNQELIDSEVPIVAVSIVPEAAFVEEVAGNLVKVVTMIPPGNSPANYQPTPKLMSEFSEAEIYFTIGVNAESSIVPKAIELNENIKLVALDTLVEEKYPSRYFSDSSMDIHEEHMHEEEHIEDHEEDMHEEEHIEDLEEDMHEEEHIENHDGHVHEVGGKDPHLWLSPKRVKEMVIIIRDELIELDPEHKIAYETNAEAYLKEINTLDDQLLEITSNLKNRSFIMYHPSLGYFADDYNLKMVAIEANGKKATVEQMSEVIDFAKNNSIKVILYQEEFDSSQANTVANEIGGKALKINPLDYNYTEQMVSIGETLEEILQK